MGLFDSIGDVGKAIIGGVGSVVGGLFGGGDPDNSMIADQIKAYKDQTALEQKQLAETQKEKDVVKRQVEQKQIRSLRGQYGNPSSGFLGGQGGSSGNSDAPASGSKLGGDPLGGFPGQRKLGT